MFAPISHNKEKAYQRSPNPFTLLRAGTTLKSGSLIHVSIQKFGWCLFHPPSLRLEKLDQNYQGRGESFQHFCVLFPIEKKIENLEMKNDWKNWQTILESLELFV